MCDFFRVVRCPLLLAALGSGTACASEELASDATGPLPFSSFRLVLRAGRDVYLVGEPIDVYAELTNPHDRPVQGHRSFGWFLDGGTHWSGAQFDLRLQVAYGGKRFMHHPYLMPLDNIPPPPVRLIGPGAKRVAKLLILGHRSDAAAFFAPGKMVLFAEFRDAISEEKTSSNELTLLIRPPEGQDAEALEWLRQRNAIWYLGYHYFVKRAFTDAELQLIEEFLSRYPTSAYAPYAHFALGQMRFYRKEYEKAAEVFKVVVERYPRSSIAEDALFLVAFSHDTRAGRAAAEASYEEVLNRFPDTVAAQDAARHLAGMRRVLMHDSSDPRLDRPVTYDFPKNTPLAEALEVLIAQCGVPLRVDPELHGKPVEGRGTRPVGEFLFEAGLHEAWLREPDGGYRLVPAGYSR